MPNWCANQLTIEGPVPDLDEFCAKAQHNGQLLSFESFLPTPPDLSNEDVYYWHIANWGVKWDVCNPRQLVRPRVDDVVYRFDTPWGPPLEALFALSEQHPTLHFSLKHAEAGMAVYGTFEVVGGDITRDMSESMSFEFIESDEPYLWVDRKTAEQLDEDFQYLANNSG